MTIKNLFKRRELYYIAGIVVAIIEYIRNYKIVNLAIVSTALFLKKIFGISLLFMIKYNILGLISGILLTYIVARIIKWNRSRKVKPVLDYVEYDYEGLKYCFQAYSGGNISLKVAIFCGKCGVQVDDEYWCPKCEKHYNIHRNKRRLSIHEIHLIVENELRKCWNGKAHELILHYSDDTTKKWQ